jgi:hypothetical protein
MLDRDFGQRRPFSVSVIPLTRNCMEPNSRRKVERSNASDMRKLTPRQEAVLRNIGDNPGCKPEGREAEQLRRFGLVELDTPTSTSLIGYRITEAGREYLDEH